MKVEELIEKYNEKIKWCCASVEGAMESGLYDDAIYTIEIIKEYEEFIRDLKSLKT